MIHYSVFDRMADDPQYDPTPLRSGMLNPYTDQRVNFRVWYGPGQEKEYTSLHDARLAAEHQPGKLKKEQQRTFIVYANQKFPSSRVLVSPEEQYQFIIDQDQRWFDGGVDASPRGWLPESAEKLAWYKKLFIGAAEEDRRHPEAESLEVLGIVNRNDQQLVRLTQHLDSPWSPTEAGEFYAFPNDLMSKYGNNLGAIQLAIKRTV